VENNTQIRRKGDPSDAPTMQRSGAKSIALMNMIWKSVKLFCIVKEMPPPTMPAPQNPRQGEHHREISDGDEHVAEINMIFGGSMSITSKTQGKKLQHEISLAQQIELERWMRWSEDYITFGPEDHPVTELSERNLPLIVKIPIGRHKVAKTLIDSRASLNLTMRKTFIEMGLNLLDLTPCMTRSTGSSQDSHLHP
jgi:hypothetical protein